MHPDDEPRTSIEQRILLTDRVRARSAADRDRIRAALRARRLK